MGYKTKRDIAGELVGMFGGYMPDAPNTPYFIRLNGKFFCSEDTGDLADQLANRTPRTELEEAL